MSGTCPLCGGLTITEDAQGAPDVEYRLDWEGGDQVLKVVLTSSSLQASMMGVIHANFCPECGKDL